MRLNKKNKTGNSLLKTGAVWTVLLAGIVGMFLLSVVLGSSRLSLEQIFNVFRGNGTKSEYAIVMSLRVPRALLAIIVGACLSVAGAGFACVLIYVMAWKDGVDPVRIIVRRGHQFCPGRLQRLFAAAVWAASHGGPPGGPS